MPGVATTPLVETSIGVGVQLRGRVLTWHAQGPGFNPPHPKKKKKKKKKEEKPLRSSSSQKLSPKKLGCFFSKLLMETEGS
jgi:hypothetical protein